VRINYAWCADHQEKEFFIDNLLVRIQFIVVMIRWTGLAPWEFEFPFLQIINNVVDKLALRILSVNLNPSTLNSEP